ncbi:hypothetical protein K503DRAFT_788209, partial [Rhizopogon vinicolor AM-OR11-026]
AKGVLACLNFKPLNDTHAHLIEGVIKSTSQDARADVRKAGKNILQAYKTILPERAESFIGLSPVTKKSSAVQGTAASQSTSFAKFQREMLAARPIISAPKDALHPASEAGRSSVQSTNSTTQHPQRGGNKGTVAPRATLQVLSHGRPTTGRVSRAQGPSSMQSIHQRRDIIRPSVPTSKLPQRVGTMHTRPRGKELKIIAPLPENDGTDLARTWIRKTHPLPVEPSAVDPLLESPISNNPIPTEAQLQTTSSQASQGTSAHHGMFRPSKPSMQSMSQQVASPLIPTNKPLQ